MEQNIKQITTTRTGLYEDFKKVRPLPDKWNGLRWKLYKQIGTFDEKSVNAIFKSLKKYNCLSAFDSIVLRKTFRAELDGVMTEYKKGTRLLLDKCRRYKALTIAIEKGYEIITPEGYKNKLPINDMTFPIEKALGKIADLTENGKETIFKILQILNFGQVEFSDESIIIGGAECVSDKDRKKVFKYFKRKLKEYKDNLTPKLILRCIFGRDKLSNKEKEEVKINYDYDKMKDISDLHLKVAKKIKKSMGNQAPAPFINVLMHLIHDWVNKNYFYGCKKIPSTIYDIKTNEPKTIWQVINPTMDCFKLSTNFDFDQYEEYLNSIINYITGTWKTELDGEKLSGEPAVAKRNIEERVCKMWEEYLNV